MTTNTDFRAGDTVRWIKNNVNLYIVRRRMADGVEYMIENKTYPGAVHIVARYQLREVK